MSAEQRNKRATFATVGTEVHTTSFTTLVCVRQNTESADGSGCLKFYRPLELGYELKLRKQTHINSIQNL